VTIVIGNQCSLTTPLINMRATSLAEKGCCEEKKSAYIDNVCISTNVIGTR